MTSSATQFDNLDGLTCPHCGSTHTRFYHESQALQCLTVECGLRSSIESVINESMKAANKLPIMPSQINVERPASKAEIAKEAHDLFLAFVTAGFTERHAVYLVASMATSHPGNPPEPTLDHHGAS